MPPGSSKGKPLVRIAPDCEHLLKEVEATELRKVHIGAMLVEDDDALDEANQRISAALYCLQQQRKRFGGSK